MDRFSRIQNISLRAWPPCSPAVWIFGCILCQTLTPIMKLLQTLVLILVSSLAIAQSRSIEYFDKNMIPVADTANAIFYRIVELQPSKVAYDVKQYFKGGSLFYTGSCLDKECMTRNGEFVFYYPNGQKKNSSFWRNGNPEGKTSHWYPNGQLKTVLDYEDLSLAVVEHYDSLGNQKVKDGNGEYEEQDADEAYENRVTIRGQVKDGKKEGKFLGYLSDGTLFCTEHYKGGQLIKGVSFSNGKEYKYTQVVDMDYMGFMEHARKTLRYPAAARRAGIQGTMWLRIIFNESHRVKDVILLQGFDPACDAEGIRICREWKPKPFYKRGQVVKVPSIVMPIKLKMPS